MMPLHPLNWLQKKFVALIGFMGFAAVATIASQPPDLPTLPAVEYENVPAGAPFAPESTLVQSDTLDRLRLLGELREEIRRAYVLHDFEKVISLSLDAKHKFTDFSINEFYPTMARHRLKEKTKPKGKRARPYRHLGDRSPKVDMEKIPPLSAFVRIPGEVPPQVGAIQTGPAASGGPEPPTLPVEEGEGTVIAMASTPRPSLPPPPALPAAARSAWSFDDMGWRTYMAGLIVGVAALFLVLMILLRRRSGAKEEQMLRGDGTLTPEEQTGADILSSSSIGVQAAPRSTKPGDDELRELEPQTAGDPRSSARGGGTTGLGTAEPGEGAPEDDVFGLNLGPGPHPEVPTEQAGGGLDFVEEDLFGPAEQPSVDLESGEATGTEEEQDLDALAMAFDDAISVDDSVVDSVSRAQAPSPEPLVSDEPLDLGLGEEPELPDAELTDLLTTDAEMDLDSLAAEDQKDMVSFAAEQDKPPPGVTETTAVHSETIESVQPVPAESTADAPIVSEDLLETVEDDGPVADQAQAPLEDTHSYGEDTEQSGLDHDPFEDTASFSLDDVLLDDDEALANRSQGVPAQAFHAGEEVEIELGAQSPQDTVGPFTEIQPPEPFGEETKGEQHQLFEQESRLGLEEFEKENWDQAVHHLSIAATLRPEIQEIREHLRVARRRRKSSSEE